MAGQEQIKRDRRDDGPDDLPELGAAPAARPRRRRPAR